MTFRQQNTFDDESRDIGDDVFRWIVGGYAQVVEAEHDIIVDITPLAAPLHVVVRGSWRGCTLRPLLFSWVHHRRVRTLYDDDGVSTLPAIVVDVVGVVTNARLPLRQRCCRYERSLVLDILPIIITRSSHPTTTSLCAPTCPWFLPLLVVASLMNGQSDEWTLMGWRVMASLRMDLDGVSSV